MRTSTLICIAISLSLALSTRAADVGKDFPEDLKKMQEIAQTYVNSTKFESEPDVAIENLKQIPGARAEGKRLAEKYAELMKGNDIDARNMKNQLKRFDEFVTKYEEAAKQYAADAPAKIEQSLNEALTMGKEAVENKRHLYFSPKGGIQQKLNQAQARADVLAALEPDSQSTKDVQAKMASAREEIGKMKASLNDEIVASNQVPRDSYNGPDKAKLVELVKSKWGEANVPGDVLRSGINSSTWKRDTRWKWDGHDTFNKSDTSKLQGYVITKTDDTHAAIHYIDLTKDHLAEDKVTASFFGDPKKEADVSDRLLVKNVK
jgi:hypothetical protein